MTDSANRLIGLLDYIEQVEKLKRKPAYIVPTDFFAAYQTELKGLPGIEFSIQVEGDDIWLRVPRLKEITPPDVDNALRPWVTISKSPEKSPQLRTELILIENKKEVGLQNLIDHPEIQRAFEWYVKELWEPWASAERPRRKTISFYNKLFAVQQTIASDGAEAPLELVWGLGYACWKKEGAATAIRHPLITQPCEILLNEQSFEIDVRPRDTDARLELDCYADLELPGVRHLEDYWKSVLATSANRVNPFEPSTFEGTLKAAVGHLDSNGAYLGGKTEPEMPAPSDTLRITDTWVLFVRKRSDHIFVQDIQRLKQRLIANPTVPQVIAGFVQSGDSTVRARTPVQFRGLSSSRSGQGVRELYFPMPYNDEQVSIVEKLETNDGVVVQGPPGTGKTHTIANVICHFLAQGKRVLVVAKSETALAVLQEKLPEQIRPLSVSLLTDERDGMRQFEHSIQTIASSVNALNPTQSATAIAALEEQLNTLHAKIAAVDQTINSFAEKHMRHYPFQGRETSPEELAKFVLENTDRFEWLDDELDSKTSGTLNFADADINSLRQARVRVGADLPYLDCALPVVDSFPVWTSILAIHKDLIRAKEIEQSVSKGELLKLVDSTHETFVRAQSLSIFLAERETLLQTIKQAGFIWSENLSIRLVTAEATDPALLALDLLIADIEKTEVLRRELLARAVAIPSNAEIHEEFLEALARLVSGKGPFVLPFGKQEARAFVANVAIAGRRPSSPEEWQHVKTKVQYLLKARELAARWNALTAEFELPATHGDTEESFRSLVNWQSNIQNIRRFTSEFETTIRSHVEMVFGQEVVIFFDEQRDALLSAMRASLSQHINKERLIYAAQQISELIKKLDGKSGPVVAQLRQFFISTIGNTEIAESTLQQIWHASIIELKRVTDLQSSLKEIDRVTVLIEKSGASRWARRLRLMPANPAFGDTTTPTDWLEAWNWRIARAFLERIDSHQKLKTLFEEKRTLEIDLSKNYRELIAQKTWLGVHDNSPDDIRQALQAYLNAIQAMGSGTGIRAVRFRRNAREAMQRAYKAVPCWVLPQWRVSETLPPEIGLFDLVVVDEASQSDIWALPALLRGKKLLVVGDHKQVSPSAIGTAELKIQELIDRFLRDQPHGAEMTPDKSIYDLARVVFAGNSVMLKEHFRCVPAIIEFSNREFYQGDIKPLRIPKASERLDPPLIDVFVRGGYRKEDTNPPEAKAIVDEIKAIIADPTLTGRSIGVVTLLGMVQAAHIAKLINEDISPTDIVERRIAVGPPPVFQGRERDIMLVSMVLEPGDRSTANKLEMEQRLNVALSRARDRMYLFRSVQESAFKPDSLTAKLIRHFRHPFTQDARRIDTLRERCESNFERDMFDLLVAQNYRVEPQVRCGGYRIDFVIEGSEGRRLAVECDGDRFHGPGQWMDDMSRQRILERAGWTFWRCFASSFVMNRERVAADLFATLDKMGIEALGAESVDNTIWTLHREADPYDVGPEEKVESEQSTKV
ncbi:AAA domain-containing protein [Undibacterium pigrum]|uniref:Uncharacterized protein DUF559 n=1 Tax=Undibacterium pigrum TaxID=401470 RepID=A0A318ILB0_9BURK|nr:AAA domain-containing protein [Undibacterium pigrum]PXX34952.1 uncharacterized protein DUF559 [Undibacterium pigrum]